ncbi:hypothetical protein [Algoriphagus winogradskyi]|uniref:Auto-transporter adhesin head GIN domain-containing protein n=1 Tax=Algoriphagus winogradskyi TaxID=237017 RepID=A0ABY1P6L5_9BACT|nr:hypothetical protein [Algoriphagus winogradskyi]SMP27751.1 hypothetical protein SAMN06265367_105141 [Algoriphagus winogradskyi]
MKKTLNPTILFLMIFGIMLVSSCDMNDEPPVPNLAVVNEDMEVNMAFEDLDNLTLSVLSTSGLSARTSVTIPASNICDGAIITLDESTKTIKVDFGDGCTSVNGIIRKGIVNLAYTGNLLITGAKITTTFEDYEVNGHKIEGTRTLTNKGVSLENGTITLEVKIQNGKVTWSDNTFVTLTSDQVRVIKLGTQGEYEASITGTASGTSRAGLNYTSSIAEPLIYTKSCIDSGVKIPNSGILAFQYSGIEVTVDYGDGACDKMATIFYPSGSKPVTLD